MKEAGMGQVNWPISSDGEGPAERSDALRNAISRVDSLAGTLRVSARTRRVFDLILLALAAPLFLLLFVMIGAGILLLEGRPIFYKHTRIGRNGIPFQMYKFRSMVPDAHPLQQLAKFDESRGKLAKRRDDPRVTRIGRFLRMTSLDELPQLLNVAKGEMTLVGPRAYSVPLEMYTASQRERLTVTPGIVGPAQIWLRHGDFDERTELELFYLNRRCAKLDLYIFLMALFAVIRPTGA